MRLFLGLPWPAESTADLVARARVWEGRPGLRPVRSENWHVTLRFLGDISDDRVADVGRRLTDWARVTGPLTFVDRGWRCFGPQEAPRVVILDLETLPAVRRAVSALHRSLDAGGFDGDGKSWRPHLTLAYGRGGDPGPWPDEVAMGRPPVIFSRAVLYESQLGAEGSTYRELLSAAFGGPGSTSS